MWVDYGSLLTLPQQKSLTILPMISGALSVIGSSVISFMILSDRRKKLSKVKHRLILAMSVIDVIYSAWFVLWGPTIPLGTPGVWLALGNRATCSAQGFFIQFGIAVPMYNAALCCYYYLIVVKGMSNDAIAARYERPMHGVSVLYPLLTGLAAFGIQGGLYNHDSLGCWIAPFPRGCKHDDGTPCVRAKNGYLFQWLFAGFEELAATIVVVVTMWLVYREVRNAERTMTRRYSFKQGSASDSRSLKNKSRQTLNQAMSYVLVVVVTRMWSFVVCLTDQFGGINHFPILVLEQFFFPMQGFWNSFIYVKPFYDLTKKEFPHRGWAWCSWRAITDPPSEDARRRTSSGSGGGRRTTHTSPLTSSLLTSLGSKLRRSSFSRRGSEGASSVGDKSEDSGGEGRHFGSSLLFMSSYTFSSIPRRFSNSSFGGRSRDSFEENGDGARRRRSSIASAGSVGSRRSSVGSAGSEGSGGSSPGRRRNSCGDRRRSSLGWNDDDMAEEEVAEKLGDNKVPGDGVRRGSAGKKVTFMEKDSLGRRLSADLLYDLHVLAVADSDDDEDVSEEAGFEDEAGLERDSSENALPTLDDVLADCDVLEAQQPVGEPCFSKRQEEGESFLDDNLKSQQGDAMIDGHMVPELQSGSIEDKDLGVDVVKGTGGGVAESTSHVVVTLPQPEMPIVSFDATQYGLQ